MKTRNHLCIAVCAVISMSLTSAACGQYQISTPGYGSQAATQNWRAPTPVQQSRAYFSPSPAIVKPNAVSYGINKNTTTNTATATAGCGCDAGCGSGCDSGCGAGCGLGSRLGGGCGLGCCKPAGCGNGCDSGGCDSAGGSGCGTGCGLGSRFGGFGNGCNGCFDPCRYFSVFGGWTRSQDTNLNFGIATAGAAPAAGGISLASEEGWALGAALGRRVNRNWRVEGEFTYRNHSFESVTGTGIAAALGTLPVDGKTNIYSPMVNLLFDVNCFRNITPYAGVGFGVAFVEAEIIEPQIPVSLALDYSTFAYQGIFGLSTCLNNRVDIFGEYRYFGTDKTEAAVSFGGTTTAAAEFEFGQHNLFFGVRIKRR